MLLLAGCSNLSPSSDTEVFDADTNADGFVDREEVNAGFERLEENQISYGKWKISADADGEPYFGSEEIEVCISPGDTEQDPYEYIFFEQYEGLLQLPDDEYEIRKFVVDGTTHEIVLEKEGNQGTIKGSIGPNRFQNVMAGKFGKLTISADRTGPC